MKIVMTLLARNEADIVDAQIAFHLHAGVDFVIATNNRSDDGTAEILERYERAGHLHLIHEQGNDMRQDEWVTRMARMAATRYHADWVLNTDADEFWWPRGGSLKEVLGAIPDRYGVVRGCWRHFLPRPDDGGFFAERMTVRLGTPAHPGDKRSIFHAHQKVAHRGLEDVSVEPGNHDVSGPGLRQLRSWLPIEVLHFSLRSVGQLERKAQGGWLRNARYEPTEHWLLLDSAWREGRLSAYYQSFVAADEDVRRGLGNGSLALDFRLRDALRSLRDGRGAFVLPGSTGGGLRFPRPSGPEEAAYASEASLLLEVDGAVRAERRIEALEERLARIEHAPGMRLRSLARRLTGGH